jgi:Flp pilus assembly protein TadD
MRGRFVDKKLLYSLALSAGLSIGGVGCTSMSSKPANPQNKSWMDKVGSSVKSGTAKVASKLSPKSSKTSTVSTPPSGKAGPNVFVAMAQMQENNGNMDEAEAQYRKALDIDPNHLNALVGYAHLEDRRNNFDGATKLYQRALKKHPKEASVHNDLGLCYHRHGKLPEAAKSLKKAVDLQPESKLYHNNLATVYVEQGKNKEALAQLVAAHGEAVGNYNLGYLLSQKHDNEGALTHFRKAQAKDASLVAASQWIEKLTVPDGPAGTHYAASQEVFHTQHASNTAYTASTASAGYPQPTSPYVQASNIAPQAAPPAATAPLPETRGVQYPATAPAPDASGYAMPPMPQGTRLPSVR